MGNGNAQKVSVYADCLVIHTLGMSVRLYGSDMNRWKFGNLGLATVNLNKNFR